MSNCNQNLELKIYNIITHNIIVDFSLETIFLNAVNNRCFYILNNVTTHNSSCLSTVDYSLTKLLNKKKYYLCFANKNIYFNVLVK